MPLNQSSIFPPARQLNVNYNWADIASATGYVVYDGYGHNIDGGAEYSLVPYNFGGVLGGSTETDGTTGSVISSPSGGYQKSIDLDFDVSEFKISQTVKGDAIIRLEWNMDIQGGADTRYSYSVVTIKKWDGVSETTVGTAQSAEKTSTVDVHTAANLKIELTETNFKKGDILRVTVELWGKITFAGNNLQLRLYHDPQDTGNNKRLAIAIPYKIEV